MNPSVVDITNEFGEIKQYKRVSARLPEFLGKYSPEEGYRVESAMTDLLSLKKGLLALYREAISCGKSPQDVGLPNVNSSTMVSTHSLFSPDGNLIASANASKAIVDYKDLEMLETASLNRLLGKLGFGGEIFDDDENNDIDEQGLNAYAQDSLISVSPSSPSEDVSGLSLTKAESQSDNTSDINGQSQSNNKEPVPAAMKVQIKNLAEQVGEPVQNISTLEEAKAALKALSKKQRQACT